MTKAITTANQRVSLLRQQLEQKYDALVSLTGGDTKAIERTVMATLIRAAEDEKLRNCTPHSVFRSVAQAVILDLNLTLGESYLVPYGGECTLLIGYQGWRKKAAQAGFNIVAEPVFAGDKFEYSRVPIYVKHSPCLEESKRGEFLGTYAVAFVGRELFDVEWVTSEDTERAKKMSRSPAWKDWPNQMRKKLAIKRLCQRLHHTDLHKALEVDAAFDAGGRADVDLDDASTIGVKVPDKLAPGSHFGFIEPEVIDAPTAEDNAKENNNA